MSKVFFFYNLLKYSHSPKIRTLENTDAPPTPPQNVLLIAFNYEGHVIKTDG